MLEVKINIF